ncbi:hypothetical protein O181_028936 [Austropuccinia psidii MF-1]|uniref:Uncharacterized protein n=1 Tax=Austropuccinia psidii MF-1 TaxID=1389203 RepID=A0A9Q3H2V2_9BASI|nr:hypothetical protein [Austropuccinia psidii MF-1]
MPVKNSHPARQKRSQARTEAILTPTLRAPLDDTPEAPQLRAKLDKGPHLEGEEPSIQEGRGPRRSSSFSGVEKNSVEEEESDDTEGAPAAVAASQSTEGPTLAQSNQPVSHQSEPSSLAIMQQMTQIMANLQEASSSEA